MQPKSIMKELSSARNRGLTKISTRYILVLIWSNCLKTDLPINQSNSMVAYVNNYIHMLFEDATQEAVFTNT